MLAERLRREPDIFLRLAESSLTVAKSLRRHYLEVTLGLAERIRAGLLAGELGDALTIEQVDSSSDSIPLTVCFVDGGVGEANLFFRVPLIVRGGVFRVREGERDLQRRETFELSPVLIGDLEGGDKSRSDYASVVRITVELMALLRVLEDQRYSDVELIMLHGPLLYRLSAYTDHWFYVGDIRRIAEDLERSRPGAFDDLMAGYWEFCKEDPEPREWLSVWSKENKVRATHMIAYLLKTVIERCRQRGVLLVGVVERAAATEVTRGLFKEALSRGLIGPQDPAYTYFGLDPQAQHSRNAELILAKGNYQDPLFLSLVLEPGEHLSLWQAEERYTGFSQSGDLRGFGGWLRSVVPISYTYLKPIEDTLALRIEFPSAGLYGVRTTLRKVYQYSRLLPRYAFPVGLDVVDKFARVPKWMAEAYRKYILLNFGRLPERGAGDATEIERILLFYHLKDRTFFGRPR